MDTSSEQWIYKGELFCKDLDAVSCLLVSVNIPSTVNMISRENTLLLRTLLSYISMFPNLSCFQVNKCLNRHCMDLQCDLETSLATTWLFLFNRRESLRNPEFTVTDGVVLWLMSIFRRWMVTVLNTRYNLITRPGLKVESLTHFHYRIYNTHIICLSHVGNVTLSSLISYFGCVNSALLPMYTFHEIRKATHVTY